MNTVDDGPSVKTCPKCFFVMRVGAKRCPECKHKFAGEGTARVVDEVSGELSEIDQAEIRAKRAARRQRARQQFMSKTVDDLIALGRSRGYKNPEGWAEHVFDARKKREVS